MSCAVRPTPTWCWIRSPVCSEGACPAAALYCGWYSVSKYVDAFDWLPGSVGYHIASFEATTLRKPESQVWCKRMLEDGICATLGAVNEPYLQSLPRPHEFFLVLMSGRYSLVETFYRTKPFNSWQLTLVGDPLYTPFRAKPGVDVQKLPEELATGRGEWTRLEHLGLGPANFLWAPPRGQLN